MWFERYVIVVTSLSKDFLPSSWASYTATPVEVAIFIGTLGIFAFGVLLFFRYIPMIAISEVKGINKGKIKSEIRSLKKETDKALEAHDYVKLKEVRQEIKHRKNQLRRAMV